MAACAWPPMGYRCRRPRLRLQGTERGSVTGTGTGTGACICVCIHECRHVCVLWFQGRVAWKSTCMLPCACACLCVPVSVFFWRACVRVLRCNGLWAFRVSSRCHLLRVSSNGCTVRGPCLHATLRPTRRVLLHACAPSCLHISARTPPLPGAYVCGSASARARALVCVCVCIARVYKKHWAAPMTHPSCLHLTPFLRPRARAHSWDPGTMSTTVCVGSRHHAPWPSRHACLCVDSRHHGRDRERERERDRDRERERDRDRDRDRDRRRDRGRETEEERK